MASTGGTKTPRTMVRFEGDARESSPWDCYVARQPVPLGGERPCGVWKQVVGEEQGMVATTVWMARANGTMAVGARANAPMVVGAVANPAVEVGSEATGAETGWTR